MAKSIMQTSKECYVCKRQTNLHSHHVFFGGNRKVSERYGMKCYLCVDCHLGSDGVHNNRELDLSLKQRCQEIFENEYSHEEFMKLIGKNYKE